VAIEGGTVTVTTTATALYEAGTGGAYVTISNPATGVLHVGGSDVTGTTGFPLPVSTTVNLQVPGGQVLYAAAATGTIAVGVLVVSS
jgi:hypothetical protein